MRRSAISVWILAVAVTACATAGTRPAGPPRVILFIADGAGLAHWSAAYHAANEAGERLALSAFPVVGLVDPANTSRIKPESASGATAFATGIRTYYEGVGVGPDSLPRASVLEAAQERGLATGVITTTLLVDATPAAFLAHVRGRRSVDEKAAIAYQVARKGVDVLMGDGRGWFDGAMRPDSTDLLALMGERYTLVASGAELRALDLTRTRGIVGFFEMDELRDPAARDPSLAEMTRAALAFLSRDPQGFFLVVENEHTDHSTHENLPLEVLSAEVRSLDEAVAVALEHRRRQPDTLVIVASDHETGGLSLVPVRQDGVERLEARFGSTDHTLTLVPIFAIGPGAARFAGLHRNDGIGRLLFEAVGAPPPRGPAAAAE